jgi:hypothetical protein
MYVENELFSLIFFNSVLVTVLEEKIESSFSISIRKTLILMYRRFRRKMFTKDKKKGSTYIVRPK